MAVADASRVSLRCCINQCPAVLVTVLVCVLWDAGEGDGYWKNSSLCLIPAYSNLHVQARGQLPSLATLLFMQWNKYSPVVFLDCPGVPLRW